MTLRIEGTDAPLGARLIDTATGENVIGRLGASELRLVIPSGGKPPRLEYDQLVEYDYTVAGATTALMPCPVTGVRREITTIEFRDGGKLMFPRDFSSNGDTKQFEDAFPKHKPAAASHEFTPAQALQLWMLRTGCGIHDPEFVASLELTIRNAVREALAVESGLTRFRASRAEG